MEVELGSMGNVLGCMQFYCGFVISNCEKNALFFVIVCCGCQWDKS